MRSRPLILAATLTAALVATLLGPTGPARAATADKWGFAYVDNPAAPVWTVLDPTRQWGSWKTAFPALSAEGMKIAPGRFLVRFPQVGTGSRGNVHVTAVNRTGHFCGIVRWYQTGADEIVEVQCHRPLGGGDDSPFTVLWTLNSGVLPAGQGSYASVQYGPASIVQAYNSTGGGVSVTPGGGGYQVRLAGVGGGPALTGNVQVTAVAPNAAPRRCKVENWAAAGLDVNVRVICHDQAGVVVPSEFTLSYHRERAVFASLGPPKYFGYVWTAGAGPTNFNYPNGIGFNIVTATAPPGRYDVRYPTLGLQQTHAQVTGYGSGPNYCHLTQPWIFVGPDALVDHLCFDNTGTPQPYRFLGTFTSRV